jgi:tetratricopeptide (TPR) repeat protein
MGTETGAARQRIQSGKPTGQAIQSASQAFAEVLLGLAVDLNRLNNRALPVGMVQVARYADPQNSAASVLLALLFESQDRSEEALRILSTIPLTDPLAPQARDATARILIDSKRAQEAYALAREASSAPGASVSDFARLGDVLYSMEQYHQSADAYGQAIARTAAQGLTTEQWPLHLLRATALESADRWDEAKQALQAGLAIAPEQPLLLNFYGYAKLERGEDLDSAEAMIRKASALDPENASITDSLGWALFKRGRHADAVDTLQRAAARDPQQSEIHEHLGDALYTMGRRYEARFAWNAALTTAEDDVATRIRKKLESGLTSANAAP